MSHDLVHVSKSTTTKYHYGRVIKPSEGESFLWLSPYGFDDVEDAETQAQNANEMNEDTKHNVLCVVTTKEVYLCAEQASQQG